MSENVCVHRNSVCVRGSKREPIGASLYNIIMFYYVPIQGDSSSTPTLIFIYYEFI